VASDTVNRPGLPDHRGGERTVARTTSQLRCSVAGPRAVASHASSLSMIFQRCRWSHVEVDMDRDARYSRRFVLKSLVAVPAMLTLAAACQSAPAAPSKPAETKPAEGKPADTKPAAPVAAPASPVTGANIGGA